MVWLTAIRVCPGTEVLHLKLCNFLCGVHPSCSFSFLSQTIDLHKQHMWDFCTRKVRKKTDMEGSHSLAPLQELECPESSIILHVSCKRVKQTPQIRSNWTMILTTSLYYVGLPLHPIYHGSYDISTTSWSCSLSLHFASSLIFGYLLW
jgi:hypothetical protein